MGNLKVVVTILAALSATFLGTTVYQSSQKAEAQKQIEENQAKLEQIQAKIEATSKLADQASEKARKADEIIAATETELKDAKEALAGKDKELAELQESLSDSNREKDAYQAGMKELSNIIQGSKEKVEELSSERAALQEKVDALTVSRAAIMDNVKALKDENVKLRKELDTLIKELGEIKKQVVKSAQMPAEKVEAAKDNPVAACPAKPKPELDVAPVIGQLACAPLDVTLQASWFSKYIKDGFDMMEDKSFFQPAVKVDFEDTGFSFMTKWNIPGSSGVVKEEEFEYEIAYENSFFDGCKYKTDYELKWAYIDFPKMSTRNGDQIDLAAKFAWPELIGCGLVPNYELLYITPVQGGGEKAGSAGFIHKFGLDYAFVTPGFIPCNPEQVFDVSWDLVYNDGASRTEAITDHDWSHMTFGVETDIALGKGTLKPGLYYQVSMDESVNDEDEFWTGVTYSLNF